MVFGWGKKKSEKQEPEMTLQKKQILLSDVPNTVNAVSYTHLTLPTICSV